MSIEKSQDEKIKMAFTLDRDRLNKLELFSKNQGLFFPDAFRQLIDLGLKANASKIEREASNRMPQISVWMYADQAEAIKEFARHKRMSRSEVVRHLMDLGLEHG